MIFLGVCNALTVSNRPINSALQVIMGLGQTLNKAKGPIAAIGLRILGPSPIELWKQPGRLEEAYEW